MIATRTIQLAGARVARDARASEPVDLLIENGRMTQFRSRTADCQTVDLSGCLLLPGLINAHDHLELNLFPRLGCGPYANYVEWAHDIHHPEQSPVKEQLAVSKHIRLLWGGLKNLLSGVTTVAQHNEYDGNVMGRRFPVRVIRNFGWAHSLAFSPDAAERFQATPPEWPFFIHAAEGCDDIAAQEIEKLDEMGMLDQRTVLVHAVTLQSGDIERLLARRCSIVWCPSSNIFLFGESLAGRILHSGIPVALGTDSALTAVGDMADEIGLALRDQPSFIDRIFEMVTSRAAGILRLPKSSGRLVEGGAADLIAVADHGQTPAQALEDLRPDLVMIGGEIRLISQKLHLQNPQLCLPHLQRVCLEDRGEYLVDADVRTMYQEAASTLGRDFRLAGKRICI